jgi:flagellar biosynthesis protein FlhB
MGEKTEDPTPRKLRKAREEGDAGVSAFAAQAVGFLVAVAVVPAAVRALADWATQALKEALVAPSHDALRFDAVGIATAIVGLSLPVLLAAGLASGVIAVVQSGGIVATKRMTPRLDRLNPVTGARNLLSPARLFAVVRALVAAAIVGWLAYAALADHLVDLARTTGRGAWVGVVVASIAGGLAWKAALVGVAIGVVDVVVTRTAWRRRLRMTKDEVRREYKESEGDPQLKAARERAHHEMLAQATVANVKNATVVVVNPTHLACALRYDEKEGDEAPVVVASGEGELAEQIKRAAEQYGIPVVHDVPLARALVELAPGDVIPEALYEAVAEILRELWETQGEGNRPAG